MYNRMVPQSGYNTASGPGGHSENQDAYNYVLPDEYWGYQGNPGCGTTYSTAPGCSGTFGGADWFAAVTEEHSNSEFTIGNAYVSASGGAKFLSISTTHNTTGIDNASQGFYSFNTFYVTPAALAGGQSFFEDTRLGARDDPDEQYLPSVWPRAFVQNNIIPWKDSRSCAYNCTVFGVYGHALFDFQTNMVTRGQVTVGAVMPTGWQAGGVFHNGINTSYNYIDGWSLNPINRNLGGFKAANFIPYTAFPIDPTTLVPFAKSSPIGKASPLKGQLAYYPPRFNAVDAAMSPFTLRADLTTLGAYDPGSRIAPASTAAMPEPEIASPAVSHASGPGLAPAQVVSAMPLTGWVQVGKEGDTVAGKAGMMFRYGSPGGPGTCGTVAHVAEGWVTKRLIGDGNVVANNDYFGKDPAYCIAKVLQKRAPTPTSSKSPVKTEPVRH